MIDDLFADPEVCQAVLMDYYRNPRCAGICEAKTHAARADNPACGDVVELSFAVEGNRVRCARTTGAGCAVSQASASLLMEQLEGKTIPEAEGVMREMALLLEGKPAQPERLDRLAVLQLITGNPARTRCAAVALDAARAALKFDAYVTKQG